MSSFSAQFKQGRVLLEEDAPASDGLPPLHRVVDDEGDDLSDDDRRRLNALVEESSACIARGDYVSGEQVLARLRALRG